MPSRESVVNGALRWLGEELTETLDVSVAREAVRKVLAFMDKARDRVLVAQDWLDARDYLTLQPSAVPGNWRWPVCYLLPADALMVREVAGCGAWERGVVRDFATGAEQRVIRALGSAEARVVVTRRIDWAAMPTYLDDALELTLAAMACLSVNGDEGKMARLEKSAREAIGDALGKDGVQTVPIDPFLPDPYGALRRSAS